MRELELEDLAIAIGMVYIDNPDDTPFMKSRKAARAILASDWLRDLRAAERREGQRDGWDEGYEAGFSRSFDMLTGYTTDRPTNPYRDNQTGATR